MTRLEQEVAALAVVVLAGVVTFIVVISGLNDVSNRVAGDEGATCRIQARGLPASHQLAVVVGDISLLLSPVRSTAPSTSRFPPETVRLLIDLRKHASAYAHITGQQPKTRHCPKAP